MQGKLLKHNLDSEVVDALKDLRDKLSENASSSWLDFLQYMALTLRLLLGDVC